MTPVERFLAKVAPPDANGCRAWHGAITSRGYGSFGFRGRSVLAHRWAYEHFVGPIPEGMTLDHVACTTKLCVEPSHLEPCSAEENLRRHFRKQTQCKQGHPLSGPNLHIRPDGKRACVLCRRAHSREAWRRARLAALESQVADLRALLSSGVAR